MTTLWAPPSALSQQDVLLPEVVVTATRTPEPLERVANPVTVLTHEDLRAAGTDIRDALRRVPGFAVVGSGSRGGATSVFSRGGQSDFNLVLIDGVKVNTAGGEFDFSDLSVDNIERIEILRGPQSALYGSEAMASVIQIFTRKGRGAPSGEVSFQGGSFETFEERAGFQFGQGDFGFSLGAGRTDTDGILKVNNAFRNTAVSSMAHYSAGERLEARLSLRYSESRFHFPTAGAGDRFDTPDPNQFTDRQRLLVAPRAEAQVLPWWRHVLHLGYYHENRVFDDPADAGVDLFGSFRSDTDEDRVSADYLWHFGPWAAEEWETRPTLGFAAERESFDQTSVSAGTRSALDESRTNYALFSQVQLSFQNRLFFTPGFRFDHNGNFGGATSPKLSLAYLIPERGTKLRGVYAEGIKAPTFAEVFGGSGFTGNPGLDPERSKSWELGLDQDLWERRVRLGFTYFHNRFTDLITFVSGATPNFVNVQEAEAKGVELTLTVSAGLGFSLTGGYTYTDSEVLDDGGVGGAAFAKGEELIRRAKHRGSFQIAYRGERLRGALTLLVVGDAADADFSSSPARRVTLPGYERVDLSLSYLLPWKPPGVQALRLEVQAQNLLDEGYEEVFGFTAPGVAVLGGFRMEFGSPK
ncbi:MAG: TonB-dependent receptor [Candidatus Tectomicrobia bacterium]|nr:TonB-dependent receptor [Candidatus Tectomicrobia bacterium]